jgi:hypothetical protein
MNGQDKKAKIDLFLANNPEFEQLSAKIEQFNVFQVLKIEKTEIRHSNVLAWLLNPEESHGFGDIVLRRIFSNILLEDRAHIKGFSAARVELMDFSDIEIRREWRNIDLLVVDRKNTLVISLENKVYSGVSPGQLLKYKKIVTEEFPSFVIIPVLLTLTDQESEDEEVESEYIPYSYLKLFAVLNNLFAQRQSQLAEPVSIFLRQYLDVLRRITMQDEKLVELCKIIYRRHREAIDLIVECGMVGAGQQAAENVLSADNKFEILRLGATVWFLPRTWAEIIPENGTAWNRLARPVSVACWFEFGKDKIYIHFEVSAMSDHQIRVKFLKKLQEVGFRFKRGSFDENSKYTRFFVKSQKVRDMNDGDEVHKAVHNLLIKAQTEFPKVEKVLQNVFKDSQYKPNE